jgi:hypothetical protein
VKLRVKMRVPGFKKLALGIKKFKEVEEQVGLKRAGRVSKSLRAAERRSDRISIRI